MEINEDEQITLRLSKSGKAVLIYWQTGETFMVSKAWMQMLLNEGAKGNMIKANKIGSTDPKRFMNKAQKQAFDKNKIIQVDGDPLSREGVAQRKAERIGIQDDF